MPKSCVLYSHGGISGDLNPRPCVLCAVYKHACTVLQVELVLAALKIGAAPGVLFPLRALCRSAPRCPALHNSAIHHTSPQCTAPPCTGRACCPGLFTPLPGRWSDCELTVLATSPPIARGACTPVRPRPTTCTWTGTASQGSPGIGLVLLRWVHKLEGCSTVT